MYIKKITFEVLMAFPVPDTWHVYGVLKNSDGSVFNNGRILAYNMLSNGTWEQIAETNIDSSTGAFTLTFSAWAFQKGDTSIEYPTLQVRVTDYNYNPLWLSQIYSTPNSELQLDEIIVQGIVGENWIVCGNVYYDSKVPLSSGYVVVYDRKNGTDSELGRCQLNAAGFYRISYTKEQFQNGDASRLNPNLVARGFTGDGTNVGTSACRESASALEYINIQLASGQDVTEDTSCKVFGTVKNKLGRPLSGLKISAFCLHYQVVTDENSQTGTFVNKSLGATVQTDALGAYSISYDASILPQGLKLDGAEAYGKDKVSLYAALDYSSSGDPEETKKKKIIYKALVFNGKREQEIDFVFDGSSLAFISLFEDLDSVLRIYLDTVISGQAEVMAYRNAIEKFLEDVDKFPLVVGREHLTEREVSAYFRAYKLYYGLLGKLGKTEQQYAPEVYAQALFGLTYATDISDAASLIAMDSTEVQELLQNAVSSGYISGEISITSFMDFWKDGLKCAAVLEETDENFSIYHILNLFLSKDLPIDSETKRISFSPLTSEQQTKLNSLLDCYYNAGSDLREFLETVTHGDGKLLAEAEWKDLTLLVDVGDFGEWYPDFVYATYRWIHSQSVYSITELNDLLCLAENDWDEIVEATSARYKEWGISGIMALPKEFTEANGNEQKAKYSKNVRDMILSWCQQKALYAKLKALLSGDWTNLLTSLDSKPFDSFRLDLDDIDVYLEDHKGDENPPALTSEQKALVRELQRLYHLTNDGTAIAYLVKNEFVSALSVSQKNEEVFVAENALGLGGKDKALQIHRLAKNFMAEASATIGKYHKNLNNSHIEAVSDGEKETTESGETGALLRSTNVSRARISSKVIPNWKTLFGSINKNGATEGQSVLSASAYFVDLLNFLKSDVRPYDIFSKRRPDLLLLDLTKANAETTLPTIDLAIELLECLVGSPKEGKTAITIVENQTLASANAGNLRAEPAPWLPVKDEEGKDIPSQGQIFKETADRKLMTHTYPASLPSNFYRTEAVGLLGNIPLNLQELSEKLGRPREYSCVLKDGLLSNILQMETADPWTSWGLDETGNYVYFPDKSGRLENKGWMEILNQVAILLDRASITYKELQELLAYPQFSGIGITIKCDAVSYQLAEINGYKLEKTTVGFFALIASFIRFRKLLGWSFEDISRRFDVCRNFATLDIVQEFVLRYELSPICACAWCGVSLSQNELAEVFTIPSLFESYEYADKNQNPEELAADDLVRDLKNAGITALGLSEESSRLIVENSWTDSESNTWTGRLCGGLNVLYRYGTLSQKLGISASELLLFRSSGMYTEDSAVKIRNFADTLRKWQGVSLPIASLEKILDVCGDEILKKAKSFNGEGEGKGTFYETIEDAHADFAVEIDISDPPEEKEKAGAVLAYKEGCSKYLLALSFKDSPYLEILAAELTETSKSNLRDNWLDGIFGSEASIIDEILNETEPYLRLKKLYEGIEPIWYRNQIFTLLSEEFGFATDETGRKSAEILLELLTSVQNTDNPSYNDWLALAKDDFDERGVSGKRILPYLKLYKANLLYQYVSAYAVKYPETEYTNGGLRLGFGFNSWNGLFSAELVQEAGLQQYKESVVSYTMLQDLVDAFFVSDILDYSEYSYGEIDSFKALKNRLSLTKTTLNELYDYAFGTDIPEELSESVNWESPDLWLKFARVYQLYLKTFTYPPTLELLFTELSVEDVKNVSETYTAFVDAVEKFRGNLKSARTQNEWNKFVQGISDTIRKERRDALATYVCWESQQGLVGKVYPQAFLDANDLYSYYLIDVNMNPDMQMSRIVQANACIQLFVERCELGLEGYTFNESALAEWDWMKNFQVWVANRKVFLYPENWVDVSLRNDKTPFFEELEERLKECGSDSTDIEAAYAEYWEKMRDISNLEIVGACKEDGTGETVYTLHIIGRTRGEPHSYYYCRYLAKATDVGGVWEPWEALDVDIQGDVVLPVIMNSRLYLMWPQFVQAQRQINAGGMQNATDGSGDQQVSVPQLEYYVEIKLAWTSFTGKKWTGIKTTKNAVYEISSDPLNFYLDKDVKEKINDRYQFKTIVSSSSVEIKAYKAIRKSESKNKQENIQVIEKGTKVLQSVIQITFNSWSTQQITSIGSLFLFADGRDESSQASDTDVDQSIDVPVAISRFSPTGTYLKHNYWVSDLNSSNSGVLEYPAGTRILGNRKCIGFRILPVNMDFYDEDDVGRVSDLPFFYMDDRGTYLVYPKANINHQREYRFELITHPVANEFFARYRNGGKLELHRREVQALEKAESYYATYSGYNYYFSEAIGYYLAGNWEAWDLGQIFFKYNYQPSSLVAEPYPASFVNFIFGTPNGIYNWELFFYVPMLIADKLVLEEQYESALKWVQLVFDPRMDFLSVERYTRWGMNLPTGARYWRFLPFFANKDANKSILETLGLPTSKDKLPDTAALQEVIDEWKQDPFDPHLIARQRWAAYQKFVVMKYLDILIARGDELFTQDTTESVNLAVQFYILAADILGPKGAAAPDPFTDEVKKAKDILEDTDSIWGNSLVEYEDTVLPGRVRDRESSQ